MHETFTMRPTAAHPSGVIVTVTLSYVICGHPEAHVNFPPSVWFVTFHTSLLMQVIANPLGPKHAPVSSRNTKSVALMQFI